MALGRALAWSAFALPLSWSASKPVLAAVQPSATLDLTGSTVGYAALALFAIAYALVMAEEFTHLRKSKPVIVAAGLIWAMIASSYAGQGMPHAAEAAVRHNILELAELFLFLFLLVAMTYTSHGHSLCI